MPNAEHSGDLGMATKEPWKGRPAAIGRVLLRLVMVLFERWKVGKARKLGISCTRPKVHA
tara:strand:+ start:338 stop:517 length:180 start_codon:yes stop_codon:yes gene_type:complete